MRQRLFGEELQANASYLLLNTVAMGAFGFVFWLIAARLSPAADVGVAASLVTALSMIAYLSLFGLSSSIVRFLPGSRDAGRLVGSSLARVALAALVFTLAYVLVAPRLAPALGIIDESAATIVLFCVFGVATAVNLLTDSVFIALRQARFNLLIDGLLQGTLRVLLPLALAGAGAWGIVAASSLPALVAAVVSLSVIGYVFRLPVRPRRHAPHEVGLGRFSGASYVSSLLNLAPNLVFPILILGTLRAEQAAFYFAAFQLAAVLYAVAYSTGESLFAETSQPGADIPALAVCSARHLAFIGVPASLGLLLVGYPLLRAYGADYASQGFPVLVVLVLAAPAVGLNTWASMLLRAVGALRILVVSNVVFAVAAIGLALTFGHNGLVFFAIAFGVANVMSGLIAWWGYRSTIARRGDELDHAGLVRLSGGNAR
jgi:O-antigen/teichoic acid export membrane protein